MIKEIKNYVNDNNWKINITNGKISIINYIDIITLEDNRISIRYQNGILVIKGDALTVNKMLDDEILITGNIKGIEFE